MSHPHCIMLTMKYDVTAKILLETVKKEILERILGIETSGVRLIQPLPTETTNLRSTDFPMLLREQEKTPYILLLEIQTTWDKDKMLGIAEYRIRYMRKYPKKEVVPYMLLLTPNENARDLYVDEYLTARFHLIKLWELDSGEHLEAGKDVQPFIPLMQGGLDHVLDIERKIYNDKTIKQPEKADLLTALTIFTGLRDKSLMHELLNRRRDIMIESPAYDVIKEEGREEGIKEGELKGKLDDARKMIERGYSVSDVMEITGLGKDQLIQGKVIDPSP